MQFFLKLGSKGSGVILLHLFLIHLRAEMNRSL